METITWNKVKQDQYQYFVKPLYQQELVERDLKSFERELVENFYSGKYVPASPIRLSVPKKGFLVRPAIVLSLEDNYIYNIFFDEIIMPAYSKLKEYQDKTDFAYKIYYSKKYGLQFQNSFKSWKEYVDKSESKALLSPVIVETDLTGFYELIDHSLLRADLRSLGINTSTIRKLQNCLDKWSPISGRGLPQSYMTSHLLARIYMNVIDQQLQNAGYDHVRYNDDFRIFCNSENEAQRVVKFLAEKLKIKGLILNSSKTKILNSADALKNIIGPSATIESMKKELKTIEISEEKYLDVSDSFGNVKKVKVKIKKIKGATEQEQTEHDNKVVVNVFTSNFESKDGRKFDKTLFRFLLSQLALLENNHAVQFCLNNIQRLPEEIDSILKYLTKVGAFNQSIDVILNLIGSNDCIFEYQKIKVLEWIGSNLDKFDDKVKMLNVVRKIYKDGSNEFTVPLAEYIIGEVGNDADLSDIQTNYKQTLTQNRKSEIMMHLQNMEKVNRDSFYKEVGEDCILTKLANQKIKEKGLI
ncbi:RNA-directed DNA polymerase [Lewinella sp. JB7]|uniref:RNA-directed DNA polymerase n=1 Tax=Lewinella sp. JB7 TaxID=2962887 RepID=UPI0020CA0F0A|nr:RNA-directed DNA polymerase [Lewinella sp. JB7]MCP9237950.1 RNA-directed DNA polymerase [Lewinella sp. JB7]